MGRAESTDSHAFFIFTQKAEDGMTEAPFGLNLQPLVHIKKIADYLLWLESLYEPSLLNENIYKTGGRLLFFRGQSDACWSLVPAVLRMKEEDFIYDEKRVFLDFKNTTDTHMDYVMDSERLLTQMQHHGIPTRMLDWTVKPLLALYLAVSAQPASTGRIFALNPWQTYKSLRERWTEGGSDNGHPQFLEIMKWSRMLLAQGWKFPAIKDFFIRRSGFVITEASLLQPLPFVGRPADPRVISQGSCFVIWGLKTTLDKDCSTSASLEDFTEYATNLCCCDIKVEHKQSVLESLRKLGFNEFSIYPDYKGLRNIFKNLHGLFRYQPDLM